MRFFNFTKDFLFNKNFVRDKLFVKKNILKNFKFAIKNKIDYIQITNPIKEQEDYLRAIGKTVSLIKLANKYNIPILFKYSSYHIFSLCDELKLKKPKVYYYKNFLELGKNRGLNLILVDETISIEDIKKIKENNDLIKIVGFSRTN